jgi:hypothetical protein
MFINPTQVINQKNNVIVQSRQSVSFKGNNMLGFDPSELVGKNISNAKLKPEFNLLKVLNLSTLVGDSSNMLGFDPSELVGGDIKVKAVKKYLNK